MRWLNSVSSQSLPKLSIEQRVFGKARALPQHIACHVYANSSKDRMIIVTKEPVYLLPHVRKQWLRIVRQLQREYASTLNADKKAALKEEIMHMESVQFVAKAPRQAPTAQIFFVKPDWVNQSAVDV